MNKTNGIMVVLLFSTGMVWVMWGDFVDVSVWGLSVLGELGGEGDVVGGWGRDGVGMRGLRGVY
ncbi:hypothetical protein J0A71_07g14560 [Encephalitozoon cuniculi]|nr:hypothetical protein J0A71_07g14560 [Encephalitozoon cuniculi]